MEAFGLLRDLAAVLLVALLAGLLCLRLKQPVLVGYLLAGMLIGPAGWGFVSDETTIAHLAEVGVILLMFALGVEFSLAQFKQLRWLVLVGGGLFIAVCAGAAALALVALGQPLGLAVLVGFILALSSTTIVMRLLMDRQELDSVHGRIMLGWLILQDLAVVPMLVAIPYLAQPAGTMWMPLAFALGKVALFLVAMYGVGTRLFPPLLRRVAYMRHKEVFFLAVIGLCFGTAAASAALGLSLALGAFLAGLVISQSDEHRQVLAEVLPIRDLFVTLFFVSIGMLIDLQFVVAHAGLIAAVVAAIMVGKALVGTAIALGFRLSARTSMLIGLGLAQIGEFSFVLAREGQSAGLLSGDLFSLTLAAALVTMLLTPGFVQVSTPVSGLAARLFPARADLEGGTGARPLTDHVVLVGYGRVGELLGEILLHQRVPFLAIDLDQRRLRKLADRGGRTLYGDAAMSEVLDHAKLESARLLVVAVPDPTTALVVVEQARRVNPALDILVRVARSEDVQEFYDMGVKDVIQPEFEAGLALIRSALTRLTWPPHTIHNYLATLRSHHLKAPSEVDFGDPAAGPAVGSDAAWFQLAPSSALVGASLHEADLGGKTGASVLVLRKGGHHILHPELHHRLEADDQLLVLGTPEQHEQVVQLLHATQPPREARSLENVWISRLEDLSQDGRTRN